MKIGLKHIIQASLLLLGIIFPLLSIAQNFSDSLAKEEEVELRSFDATAIENFRNDNDFKYEKEVNVETYSFWDYFWDFLADIFIDSDKRDTLEVFLYILCGGIMLFVILKLAGVNPRQLFYGKSDSGTVKTAVSEEDIHSINFEEQIAEAEHSKDWREAVRLHYLQLLKRLSDEHLIAWKINKTNHDYEIEINSEELKQPFHQVTVIYERVCYGHFIIDEHHYSTFKEEFQNVGQKVA